ncbi:MAG: hypothetical protein ABW328_11685 [Ilumatobacteraceae bacterium]
MAPADTPPWRQGFDAVERQVAPRVDSVIRSEGFAVAVGLAARAQRLVQDGANRASRRVLHGLNLPAGTDVTRILNEIGQLKRQVRELTSELDEARAATALPPAVAAPATRPTKAAATNAAKRPTRRAAQGSSRKAG